LPLIGNRARCVAKERAGHLRHCNALSSIMHPRRAQHERFGYSATQHRNCSIVFWRVRTRLHRFSPRGERRVKLPTIKERIGRQNHLALFGCNGRRMAHGPFNLGRCAGQIGTRAPQVLTV
jgi:hypothetical protein